MQATEQDRTRANAEPCHPCHGVRRRIGLGELLRDPLTRLLGQAGVDLRCDARVGVPREHGRLRERQAVLECEPDWRMPEVVQTDALTTVVQPGPVARLVEGAEYGRSP